ncbi:hypothetical protein Z945_1553 [Sulfitobacter noctilucae]|uniref:hypothetical protein n=1 Tax=Sulfitobacter noctilucae TaxID=1342302 RepID=UPI000468521B|nr:hypothetical protein [Sulfitobacter noctilucae]KIN60578.1 hypothetical protein Z945_1553 [Sulfitobacter noctilucae]
MASIITSAQGSLAYWTGKATGPGSRAFDHKGNFSKPELCGFSGLSAFAANSNHPPADFEGAVTWDAGVDLLFRIAGAR